METIWSVVIQMIMTLWWVAWWLVGNLLWLVFWFILPLLVIGFIGVRVAESVIGKPTVRAWVQRHALGAGRGAARWLRRIMFALSALPIRVLGWLFVYAIWHSFISLFWKPRWSPWQKAWSRRWRQRAA